MFSQQWNEADEYSLRSLSMLAGLSERLSILLPKTQGANYEYFEDVQQGLPELQGFPALSTLLVASHAKSFDKNLKKIRQQLCVILWILFVFFKFCFPILNSRKHKRSLSPLTLSLLLNYFCPRLAMDVIRGNLEALQSEASAVFQKYSGMEGFMHRLNTRTLSLTHTLTFTLTHPFAV